MDLPAVVRRAVELFAAAAREKKVEIAAAIEEAVPPFSATPMAWSGWC